MLGAEAEFVGFDTDIGLHHSGTHYILDGALFEHIAHFADGTGTVILHNFADGDCKNTFSHTKNPFI